MDPSTPDQERRYVEDFEAAASYTDTTEDFVTHKVFHNLFKRGLGAGSARLKHDEIMRRPHIRLHWNNAEVQERAYLADTYNDTPAASPYNLATLPLASGQPTALNSWAWVKTLGTWLISHVSVARASSRARTL